jgi:hypothetical protein
LYLVVDAVRMNRSDGSLIRLTTPMMSGETTDAAQQRLVGLASNIVPHLEQYVPR